MSNSKDSEQVVTCKAVFEDKRALQRMGNSYGVTLPSWLVTMHRLLTMPIKSGIVLRDERGEERWYLIDLKSEKEKPKKLVVTFPDEGTQAKRLRPYVTV